MAATATLALMGAGAALQTFQAQQAAKAKVRANHSAFEAQARQAQLAHRIQERQRRYALSRETAARRARFGAAGTGSAAGSGGAVIGGLHAESARQGRDNTLAQRAGLESSLVNVQNSNRAALLDAAHKSQGALFSAISSGLTKPVLPGGLNALQYTFGTSHLAPQPR